jgi:restriction system protein
MAALLWLIPIALAGLGLALWRRARAIQGYGRDGERLVGTALERLFPAVLHDVILPNARSGLTQIDHIALTPKGLLVVETKHYRGTILGNPEDRQWVQQRDGRRRLFQNPCRQNYAHLKAVEALGLDVPILELVVFTDSAQFPNGLPDGVSQLARLEADLALWRRGRVSARLRHAWTRLQQAARQDAKARRAHRRGLRARHGWDRRSLAAGVCLILAVGSAFGLWQSSIRLPERSWSADTGANWAALIEWLMRVWPEFLRFDAQR